MSKGVLALLIFSAFFLSIALAHSSIKDWYPWPWINYNGGPACALRENQLFRKVNKNSRYIKEAISVISDIIVPQMTSLLNKSINFPAAISWGIVFNGEILATGNSGIVDRITNKPPTNTSVYGIGSCTKIFTTFAFMQAIERGLATLDDPLTKYFNAENPPIFKINNPYTALGSDAVTLHSLATHTSGLPREAYCGIYQSTAPGNCTVQDIFDALARINLLAEPYKMPHYSNLGVSLLGRALERVWNTSYEQYIQENIFNPLEMNSSGFAPLPKQIRQNLVLGHNPFGNQTVPAPQTDKPQGFTTPAGGMYTTVLDALQFLNFTMSRPYNSSILSQNMLLEYFLPGINFPDGINAFGLAAWEPFLQFKRWVYTKGGSIPGYGAILIAIPEMNLGMCAFTNVEGGPAMANIGGQMTSAMIQAVELDLGEIVQSVPIPPNFDQFLGTYGNGQLTIEAGVNGTYTGIIFGDEFIYAYDPIQNLGDAIAMRYTYNNPKEPCLGRYEMGNGGVAYFFNSTQGPAVTLPDQNWSFYNVPKTS